MFHLDSHSSIKGINDAKNLGGVDKKIGIVYAQWNLEITSSLLNGAVNELKSQGVLEHNIVIQAVPGSYELPYGAKSLIQLHHVDAVIVLGCLIKGETMHFEYICEAVTQGVMKLGLESNIPVIFGVLAVLTEEQAKVRAGLLPGGHNHGISWAQGALQMASIKQNTWGKAW